MVMIRKGLGFKIFGLESRVLSFRANMFRRPSLCRRGPKGAEIPGGHRWEIPKLGFRINLEDQGEA